MLLRLAEAERFLGLCLLVEFLFRTCADKILFGEENTLFTVERAAQRGKSTAAFEYKKGQAKDANFSPALLCTRKTKHLLRVFRKRCFKSVSISA